MSRCRSCELIGIGCKLIGIGLSLLTSCSISRRKTLHHTRKTLHHTCMSLPYQPLACVVRYHTNLSIRLAVSISISLSLYTYLPISLYLSPISRIHLLAMRVSVECVHLIAMHLLLSISIYQCANTCAHTTHEIVVVDGG